MPRTPPKKTLDVGQLIKDLGRGPALELLKSHLKEWIRTRANTEVNYRVHARLQSPALAELTKELERCGLAIDEVEQMIAEVEAYVEPGETAEP